MVLSGVGQFKSSQIDTKAISSQIKSWIVLRVVKSNHDLRRKFGRKSNRDLISISNQNFGCNQNQSIIRSKLGFHRQIWHRSKGLSDLFGSVPLVMIGFARILDFSLKQNGSIMISQIQIKSNHW